MLHDVLYDVIVFHVWHSVSGGGGEWTGDSRDSKWIKMAGAPSAEGTGEEGRRCHSGGQQVTEGLERHVEGIGFQIHLMIFKQGGDRLTSAF